MTGAEAAAIAAAKPSGSERTTRVGATTSPTMAWTPRIKTRRNVPFPPSDRRRRPLWKAIRPRRLRAVPRNAMARRSRCRAHGETDPAGARVEAGLLGRGDARARRTGSRAERPDPRLPGHPPATAQRPVHDARPRDRRPADFRQGRGLDLAALRRDGRARREIDRLSAARSARPSPPPVSPRSASAGCPGARPTTCAISPRISPRAALDPKGWRKLDDEALIARAGRGQGHRPLDRRDVPHLPRIARGRASGRRHRPPARDRAALQRRPANRRRPPSARLARDWQPYRSVATWYLWRSLDPVPVEY